LYYFTYFFLLVQKTNKNQKPNKTQKTHWVGFFFRKTQFFNPGTFGWTGGTTKRGPQRPEYAGQQSDFLARWVSLRHLVTLKFTWCSTTFSDLYKTSEFRKLYLKLGNSSKTACSCNAEFVVSCCRLTSEIYVGDNANFYRTRHDRVEIRPW